MWVFTREFLGSLRRKAIRRRVLYCLDEIDRGILLLSSRLVDVVKGPTLVSHLMDIVEKLGEALRSRFDKHVESFGIRRVIDMVRLAIGFGSSVARDWLLDSGFSRYLAFIDINGFYR